MEFTTKSIGREWGIGEDGEEEKIKRYVRERRISKSVDFFVAL